MRYLRVAVLSSTCFAAGLSARDARGATTYPSPTLSNPLIVGTLSMSGTPQGQCSSFAGYVNLTCML